MYIEGAICVDMATSHFFPKPGQSLEPALGACARCPVREECKTLNAHERLGVWGGVWHSPRSKTSERPMRCPSCKERYVPSQGRRTTCSKCAGVESFEEEDEPAAKPHVPGECVYCGNSFELTVHHKVFCSRICQRRSQYPESFDHDPRPCDHCGESFVPSRKNQRFCDIKCRKLGRNNERRREKLASVVGTTKTCDDCGDEFEMINPDQKFCSERCRWRSNKREDPFDTRSCDHCGEDYTPKRKIQRFCSPACRDIGKTEERRRAKAS